MEVTMTEIALFIWAIAATAAWQQAKYEMKTHKLLTFEIFCQIGRGKLKVVQHEEHSFEIKEV
jgi:hypothetical protein